MTLALLRSLAGGNEYPNPFMDEVRAKAVVLCVACNRRAGLSALLDYLGLEGFGIGSAL